MSELEVHHRRRFLPKPPSTNVAVGTKAVYFDFVVEPSAEDERQHC